MPRQTLTCLSVRQPWASLLLSGEDWCENRSWMTDYRGPLWIHAAGKVETAECERWGIDPRGLMTSAVLGGVELLDIRDVDDLDAALPALMKAHHLNRQTGPEFIVGDYCWIVGSPRQLKTPVPAKGKLGLWRLEVDRAQVEEFTVPQLLIQRTGRGTRRAHPKRRQ